MKNYPLLLMLLISSSLISQDALKPNVFLDCQTNCHTVFTKDQVNFINYIRDRQAADIYVLITSQRASAGAREIQMLFSSGNEEDTVNDTIKYIKAENISALEEQELFVKHLKKGLLPYIIDSPLAENINYSVDVEEAESDANKNLDDPWNYWSFGVSVNLSINGEASFEEQGLFGRISASRVTENEKIFISTFYDFEQSTFTLSDGEEVSSKNERNRTFAQYVKSINDHWSIGIRSLVGSSSFGNTDFEVTVRPAIEYNIYPYSDNSTRRFTIMYSNGIAYKDYTELTVFDRLEETRWRHGIDVEFAQTQKWGDISIDLEFDQFLHDLSLYSISLNPNVELNFVKGLSLEFGGFFSYVKDRINIAKGEVSDEDIILQNIQLDTNYSYFSYFGFSYRFGSQNNNIVNPRF